MAFLSQHTQEMIENTEVRKTYQFAPSLDNDHIPTITTQPCGRNTSSIYDTFTICITRKERSMVSVKNPNQDKRFYIWAALKKDWQYFPAVVGEFNMQGR